TIPVRGEGWLSASRCRGTPHTGARGDASMRIASRWVLVPLVALVTGGAEGDETTWPVLDRIEAQPLHAQGRRLREALEFICSPLGATTVGALAAGNVRITVVAAARRKDPKELPVEVVVNGLPVAARTIPADGSSRELSLEVPIERSSWVAVRTFPLAHTNPI